MTASIAARRTSCRYRLLFAAFRIVNVPVAQTSPGVERAVGLQHGHPPIRPCPARSPNRAMTGHHRPAGRDERSGSNVVPSRSGISVFRNGHTIRSGACTLAAASIAGAELTTATDTS